MLSKCCFPVLGLVTSTEPDGILTTFFFLDLTGRAQPIRQSPTSQAAAWQNFQVSLHWLWLLSPNVVFNYVSIVLFTSKDLGVRCWDENLLAQRERGEREATSWPWLFFFFLPESSKGSLSRCPSSFSVLFLANSCRLLAGSTPWSKTEFINTVSGFTVLAQSRVSQCNQISRNM